MILRLSQSVLCVCLVAALGCHNSLDRANKFGERDPLETRLSFASDDLAGLETGRGHLPSLASEIADRQRSMDEPGRSGISGGSPLTVQRLLERGYDADSHGRAQEAKMYYEEVLTADANQPDAHHRLAILADLAGDFATAQRHYQSALRGKPNDADVLNDLGYSCFLQGRPAESERYLNQALASNPRHPRVQENLSLLYDPAKAQSVLLKVMGPRQAQQTLAQLFPGQTRGEVRQQIAQMPYIEAGPQARGPVRISDQNPADLNALQQKMEDARLKSIAERQQRKTGGQQIAEPNRLADLPQMPAGAPLQTPPRIGLNPGEEVPAGRINDLFRSIDASGHSQRNYGQTAGTMTNPSSPANMQREMAMRSNPGQMAAADSRAQAPEWNAPLEPWPQYAPETVPGSMIEQANFTQTPPAYQPNQSARPTLASAAQRAAEIGMAAGPGAMFPHVEDSFDTSTPSPVPAMRSLPGTDSRMNGGMYQQPSGQGVPGQWDPQASQPLQTPAGWGQPANSWNGQSSQPPAYDARFQRQPQQGMINPANAPAPDAYDQMRSAQNAQFNQDERAIAANPSLMTSGPPSSEAIPGTFDPSQQNWPAYTREQYDARRMEQPPANPQAPLAGHGQFDGQIVPQYNPATQQAPQNYGRSW